jgi:tetratricopeptide (TPR) repeat protein
VSVDDVIRQAGDHLRAGRLGAAEALANRALAERRRHPDGLAVLGRVAMRRAQYDLAATCYREALLADKRRSDLHAELATANLARGRLPDALAGYERALKLRPDDDDALAGKAEVLERTGKRKRSIALLEGRIRGGRATPRMAVVHVRALQGEGDDAAAVRSATEQLARPDVTGVARRALLLLLGRSHDRLGEVDRAFAAFREGNATAATPFDGDALARDCERLMQVFTPDALAALPRPDHGSRRPVLVFGMPRSGTTLIEQIIHAHPAAAGAGEIHDLAHLRRMMPGAMGTTTPYPECVRELDASAMETLAASYLGRLREHAPKADRIVDKSLENAECLGLAALLLPQASLIHARRHPLDTCLSCFMQDLSPQLHAYASDLGDLARFYRAHDRLMRHWRETLDVEMLEVDYEDLVADQATVSRRIIDHVGLAWDDRCLRFHEAKRDVSTASYDQVRRPIYATAVARHERYAAHLGPLRDGLGDVLDDRIDAPGEGGMMSPP